MSLLPSRIAAQEHADAVQRAAIIANSKPGSLIATSVLFGRLHLGLVAGALICSVGLLFFGSYLQFISSTSTISSPQSHHQLNSTTFLSRFLAIDVQPFKSLLFPKDSFPQDRDDVESSVLIFVGAVSASVELLLLLAILLEHFKASLMISLAIVGSFIFHCFSSSSSNEEGVFKLASMTFQLIFVTFCLLFTVTLKVKAKVANRLLLLLKEGDEGSEGSGSSVEMLIRSTKKEFKKNIEGGGRKEVNSV